MSKIFSKFKSKYFIGFFALLVVIMVVTNPGQLGAGDFAAEIGMPSENKYHNFVIFSYGNEWVSNQGYIKKDDGQWGYKVTSYRIKYIGIFKNYFCFVLNQDTNTQAFQIISK